jgi:hypothetical protein
MAFHPFKHFRKHQKVYLAGLTILTMIIFVASFGAGDLFTTLQRWLALSVRRGDKVLPLYGKTIYTDDLEKLRWQRQLASEFLLYDVGANLDNPLQKSLADFQKKFTQKKGTNDLPSPMEEAFVQMQTAMRLASDAIASNAPLEQRLQPLRNALASIQTQSLGKETDPTKYHALDAIATNLALQAWFVEHPQWANASYFGGSLRAEDLLDFLIWKHQADRLGIVLTPADVCREVNRAWGNGQDYLRPDGPFDTNEWVVAFFRHNSKIHKNLTPRDLLHALTDEFRVQMAKQALLGSASGVRGYRDAVDGIHVSPSAATPDEFYAYFREQRTALSVSLLPIAVERFLAEAKKRFQPTEADLRNLYERYKNDEPSPARRQPGFKEPRRIKVGYFSYRTEGPLARKLAAKAVELLPFFRVGQPASAFAAGGGLAWAASIASYADLDMALLSLYEKYREEIKQFGRTYDLLDQRTVELQAAAATLGQLLGSLSAGSTPLAGPTSWLATNALYVRNTMAAYASTVLAGASTSPLPALTLPLSLYVPQPFDSVRPQLLERFQNTLAKNLMDSNILHLRKEMDKVLASHSEDKLANLLKKAVDEYGIENIHFMKTAQTRQEILDHPDPALAELRQAYENAGENPFERFALFGPRESRPDFVAALFHNFEPTLQERQFEQLLKQERPWRTKQFRSLAGDTVWVFWRSEDLPAHVRPFSVVRNEVEEAWYLEQARKLAREKAQQIHAELQKQNLAPEAALQFLVQQNLGNVFRLDKVAHLTVPEFNLPGAKVSPADYRPYVPPKELFPYPPSDFVDQLLKLKKRGESLVMADKPVKHFYVAVLMEDPQPPERQEFYDAYRQSSLPNLHLLPTQEEPLWYQMMAERQRKYEQEILVQLRTEATPDLQDGEYVLPDSVRNRSESGRDFGE